MVQQQYFRNTDIVEFKRIKEWRQEKKDMGVRALGEMVFEVTKR